jgi:hypothetical protein
MASTQTMPSQARATNVLLRPVSIVLAMLSLSIGWGIRGNYGHQAGAMMPGMLCAVAIALFSGREDWRRRVPFFAALGATGWAFGGAISYMVSMSYTQSGHFPTMVYGFFMVFLIGFLWSSLGTGWTAYAAVEDRERLTAFFRPFCWVLAAFALLYVLERPLIDWYMRAPGGAFDSNFRQADPFYWLDANWLQVSAAIVALCLFDLWDRRGEKLSRLVLYGAMGAGAGFAIHHVLIAAGWLDPILRVLVHVQGDTTAINLKTGQPFPADELITNWPILFRDLHDHMGWILGLIGGLAVYFFRFGKWRSGSSLLIHMAVSGFACFLIGPVLLTNACMGIGGIRMVPPRGESWAIVLGYFLGFLLYMLRNRLKVVATASLIGGTLGGLGFMVAQFGKMLAMMPGNPVVTHDPATLQAWSHWRMTNFHSLFTEQGVGLFYGLAMVVAMAVVNAHTPVSANEPRPRRWTEVFSIGFILILVVYVNMVKNVVDYTTVRAGNFRSVPLQMKMPLFAAIELSALGWFNVLFGAFAVCVIALLIAHSRRRLAFIPPGWLGRGQLFYLVFLWMIVIGNFDRAMVAFTERRLVTEGLIFINALVVTFLILVFAPEEGTGGHDPRPFQPVLRKILAAGFAALLVFAFGFSAVEHSVYGNQPDSGGGHHIRFGPNADWRTEPTLIHQKHM